jgi:hypothetical protein
MSEFTRRGLIKATFVAVGLGILASTDERANLTEREITQNLEQIHQINLQLNKEQSPAFFRQRMDLLRQTIEKGLQTHQLKTVTDFLAAAENQQVRQLAQNLPAAQIEGVGATGRLSPTADLKPKSYSIAGAFDQKNGFNPAWLILNPEVITPEFKLNEDTTFSGFAIFPPKVPEVEGPELLRFRTWFLLTAE